MGELVGASGPTRPFGELDNGCYAVWDSLSEASGEKLPPNLVTIVPFPMALVCSTTMLRQRWRFWNIRLIPRRPKHTRRLGEKVPESVEFHLPVAGKVADSPPDGYFTCFEAYLMQRNLCFPLSEAIVRLFSCFGLSIGQVNPCGLQHVVGILMMSYERGMTFDVDHLEGLLMPKGSSATVQLSLQNHMAIIVGFVSNYHTWKNFFFFVRIDNASVEESCIPILRTRWGRKVNNPLPPTPDGLYIVRDLLRGGPFFWATFTPKRVHRAVALHRSRFQPDLPVKEGAESSMDRFVPYEAPAERERSRTRKDKHIAVDDDAADGECFPENFLGDYLNSGELIDLDELLGSDFHAAERGSDKGPKFTMASRMVNGGLLMMNRALDASNQKARMAQFRAEMADKEIARLRDDWSVSRCIRSNSPLWRIGR
ncbi:hypothetical protein F2Q69_00006478 [Brassica cretica]|uniref:Uncharacterized protein n=1 Tax=Brassica cretica TaxID=69181 RepID=A0A8S9PRM3_BRACR|nr:hypothetical protein F2Q69_00006478 [Brassica cretica]